MSEHNKRQDHVVKDPLGQDGVTESPHDLPADEATYEDVKKAEDPTKVPTPTSPDDEKNTVRAQTENMNEHIAQNVPPDF